MSATARLAMAPATGGQRSLAPAALACMGVVFGDIGTSPLYTLNVAAKAASPDGQPDAGGRARHRVADLLVADRRHLDQVRDPDHARRQSRRGRHSGPARAGQPAPRQAQPTARRAGGGRPHRRDAALRRRHDHAGDLGPVRDRRAQALRAADAARGRAAHRRAFSRSCFSSRGTARRGSAAFSARSCWSGSSSRACSASAGSSGRLPSSPR